MTEQKDLSSFTEEPSSGSGASLEKEPDGTVLFRLSTDPFVNVGASELARKVDEELLDVEASHIRCSPNADTEKAIKQIMATIGQSLSNTHRRKTVAHEINRRLDSNDSRRIPSPQAAFPGSYGDGQTVYPDDEVDVEILEEHGIDSDGIERVDDEGTNLYAQSPIYVGNNNPRHFPNQVTRYETAIETFLQAVRKDLEVDDKPCMSCGGEVFPAYKGVDGAKLEYNQTFTVLASSSGRTKPLGMSKSRDSAHRGRCVACLVAGFYYAFMPKIIRETDTNENDTRVFAPRGDFTELNRVQGDLASLLADVDEPVGETRPPTRTLGRVSTPSRGIQSLDLYESIYRWVNNEYSGGLFEEEIKYRPTAFITYVSEVGRTRSITDIETIDPGNWAYEAVSPRDFPRSDGTSESYWPVTDVLWWFGEVDGGSARQLTPNKDDIAFGILEQDLARIERGVTTIARTVNRTRGSMGYVPAFPHPGYTHHYFSTIMSDTTKAVDRIEDSAVEAIQEVATSIGRVFHANQDIGVLINLQNASTSTEFLRAFEKASMQAQKASLEQAPAPWDTSKDEEVATVLKLIKNETTFEPTKRMFVIHAALAAQYQNAKSNDQSDETATQSTGGEEA